MTADPSAGRHLIPPELREAADAALEQLERRVEALPERAMRRRVLLIAFADLSELELVAWLVGLVHRVASGRPASRVLLVELALDESVLSDLPYERLAAAYARATAVGAEGVARMFLGAPARENLSAAEAIRDNEHLPLPLGYRRAAARTRDRMVIDRLLHDRNPAVIALLLENPRLVERDVVKIAAMRPTWPEVLTVLARHGRWASSYRVRKALTCNPYTPRSVALRLLPGLLLQDLRAVLGTLDLDPAVAAEVRRLVSVRGGRAPTASAAEAVDEDVDALISGYLNSTVADPLAPDVAPLGALDLEAAELVLSADSPARAHESDEVEGGGDLMAEVDALLGGMTLIPVAQATRRDSWEEEGEG